MRQESVTSALVLGSTAPRPFQSSVTFFHTQEAGRIPALTLPNLDVHLQASSRYFFYFFSSTDFIFNFLIIQCSMRYWTPRRVQSSHNFFLRVNGTHDTLSHHIRACTLAYGHASSSGLRSMSHLLPSLRTNIHRKWALGNDEHFITSMRSEQLAIIRLK